MKIPLIPALSLCVIISSVTAQETTLAACVKSCEPCFQLVCNDRKCDHASCTPPNNKFCKTTFDGQGKFKSGECVEKRDPAPADSSHSCSNNTYEGPCFCSGNSCNDPAIYFRQSLTPNAEGKLVNCCMDVKCTELLSCNSPEHFCYFKFNLTGDEYDSVTCGDDSGRGNLPGCDAPTADAECSCDASITDKCNKAFVRRDQLNPAVIPTVAGGAPPASHRHSSSKPTDVTDSGSSRLQMNILTIVAVFLPLASFLGVTLFSSLFRA